MSTAQTIPVVDLRWFYGSDRDLQRFIDQVGRSLQDIGFFALVHSGVDSELVQAAYRAAQHFFSLPEAVKLQYQIPGLNGQRGFTQFGREHAKDHPFPDLKEFWHVGREPDHTQPCSYPANVSPVEAPQLHPILSRLYAQLEACATDLLKACALYLGEPENLLSDMIRSSDTILRLTHYPPLPPQVHPASLRAAPHEDINLITLLCEPTADGLELLQRDGSWLPISALPGQIIVDSGDMLQHLTNGVLKSTTHRVVNPECDRQRRFSLPFFVHPRSEVDLTPLPTCVARSGQPPFARLTAGEYLQQRLKEIGLLV
jgi:isopenicillin N synthase-like dioxygenase